MNEPRIVFGMNSMFAVHHMLPETVSLMRAKGFDVVVVAPPAPPLDAPESSLGPGVDFLPTPMDREIAPISDLRALCRIWSVLKKVRPTVTDMSTPKMALLGGLAALLARVPHRIYTLRGLRYETARSWKRGLLMLCEKIACACAHHVICISRSVRERAIRDHLAPRRKLLLLGERSSEGIAIRRAAGRSGRATLREQLGVSPEIPVIGFVGRLTRDKGVGELAAAFRKLRADGRRLQLLVLGDFESGDPVDKESEEWIRTCPDVHWLGFVTEPAPYYELMDMLVLPTYREGLGKVLLEAAAAGKPVVSTRTTGVIDVVIDGVTGLLVPARDSEALADAMSALLDDPEKAAGMGRAAQALVREHFDNSIYLSRLGNMIESMARREISAAP